jgi:transposase
VISGIIFVIRNGCRWRDAPRDYGPHKTIYNRFVRWSRLGVFNKVFAELASKGPRPQRLMIDATHLKAHRTAASLLVTHFMIANFYFHFTAAYSILRHSGDVDPFRSSYHSFELKLSQ